MLERLCEMKTKNETYTWNEDLQRVISGDMPQDIEAHQHDKKEKRGRNHHNYPVDDVSEFLPHGYRRSEKWIAARETRERKERASTEARLEKEHAETIERQNSYSDLNEFGSNPDFDIPHNQNRVGNFEIWVNDGGILVIVVLVIFGLMGIMVYLVNNGLIS